MTNKGEREIVLWVGLEWSMIDVFISWCVISRDDDGDYEGAPPQ